MDIITVYNNFISKRNEITSKLKSEIEQDKKVDLEKQLLKVKLQIEILDEKMSNEIKHYDYKKEKIKEYKGYIEIATNKISNLENEIEDHLEVVLEEYKDIVYSIEDGEDIIEDFDIEEALLLIGDIKNLKEDIRLERVVIETYKEKLEYEETKEVFKEGRTFEEYKDYLESLIEETKDDICFYENKLKENIEKDDKTMISVFQLNLQTEKKTLRELEDDYMLYYGI